MKEKADAAGQNLPDSSENEKKLFSVETQASLQQAKEKVHSPLTDGKKLDSCFRETNDVDTATHKLLQSHDIAGECLPPSGEDQLREVHSSVNYIRQEHCEPNDNGIIMEFDESGEGHTEATSNCKSILIFCDEVSRVTGHSELTQSYIDLKANKVEASARVADLVFRHSSMILGYSSEIREIDRPTASDMTRNLQDDESKDFGSSTYSLVDLMTATSIESPVIDLDDSPIDNNDGRTNVKEAVLESSKYKDELASIIEKDLHEILLVNTSAVDGNDIAELEVITNSLPASPVNRDESHLHREVEETHTKVEISGDLVSYAPYSASVNTSSVATTAKLMKLESLTNDSSENSIMDGSKLSRSPLSGSSDAYLDEDMETIDLDDKVEELQESCSSIDVRDHLSVSERVKSFRSIKRKILDAFTSRRRTAKDYEQLGILHGYIDFEPDLRSTVPSQVVGTSVEHPNESDWELV